MASTPDKDSPGPGVEGGDAKRDYRREMISTLLLSLATVASTWSAYQSSLWSGLQATRFSEAATARTKSEGKSSSAVQETSFDAGMFIQYAAALLEDNPKLAQFLYKRFRPEMKAPLDAWLATRPLQNADAPSSPFAMGAYALEDARLAQQLAEDADQKFELARAANQKSDKYVLLTVLFTSVLFFTGVGGKTSSRVVTRVLLGLGLLIFVIASAALVILPFAPT